LVFLLWNGQVVIFWSLECTCQLGMNRRWIKKIRVRGVEEAKKRMILVFLGEDRLPNQMKVWEVQLPTRSVDRPQGVLAMSPKFGSRLTKTLNFLMG
jgi:hypothetical protein